MHFVAPTPLLSLAEFLSSWPGLIKTIQSLSLLSGPGFPPQGAQARVHSPLAGTRAGTPIADQGPTRLAGSEILALQSLKNTPLLHTQRPAAQLAGN